MQRYSIRILGVGDLWHRRLPESAHVDDEDGVLTELSLPGNGVVVLRRGTPGHAAVAYLEEVTAAYPDHEVVLSTWPDHA